MPEVPFAPGTVSSGSLQAGQRLAKPGLSGFNSNSSPHMAQILIGNGMILMVNREDSSRKSRSVLASPALTHPSYLTEEDALPDPFNLERFVDAQADVYSEVLTELREGRKRSHWIWFIFPQMKGLGHSPQAAYYGIGSLDEAVAYLRHPVLGQRLMKCTQLVNQVKDGSIQEILGWPDDMKFRSSMTLFARAAGDDGVFRGALEKYFDGEPDRLTLEKLG